jgi:hypothetical protein
LRYFFKILLSVTLIWLFCCAGRGDADAKFGNDPTYLTVGARVLGMGDAFVGVADDPAAIFLNPAGLGRIDDWQISSMSAKYLNIFDYRQLSGVYPTRIGTFGLGYGDSSIEFHYPSSEVIVIGDEIVIVPTGEVNGKYSNTALLVSYANHLSPSFMNDIELGGSLKFLSQNISATGLVNNQASGMEMNLGAFYPVNANLKLGMSVINALPASLGGKIKWTSQQEETFPALLKTGLSFRPRKELQLSLDMDKQLTRKDVMSLLHAGVEWWPGNSVAVRAGVDQSGTVDPGGNPAASNDFSLGLGFLLNGFRFDYAYHTYNNIADNATHYFSLTYGIWPEKLAAKRKDEYFSVVYPDDRAQLFDETVQIQGKVIDKRVNTVKVRGQKVGIDWLGAFKTEVPLELGGNRVTLEAFDNNGKSLKRVVWKIARLRTFWDVDADYWARQPIGQLGVLGVIRGYPNGSFRPEDIIIRSEIVALLMRTLGTEETNVRHIFRDVSRRHWAAGYIEAANANGIVEGYSDRTFQPAKAISRAEGATIVARFDKLPFSRVQEAPYSDVPGRHWAARAITQLKERGYLDFITGDKFHWQQPLSRGEVAAILAKTNYIKEKFEKMLDE